MSARFDWAKEVSDQLLALVARIAKLEKLENRESSYWIQEIGRLRGRIGKLEHQIECCTMGEGDKAMQNSIHDRTEARLEKLEGEPYPPGEAYKRAHESLWKAIHNLESTFEDLVYGEGWTPSAPEQVAHLEVNEIKEMRKKADDYNARLREEEKAHRKHLEEMLAEYKKRWGSRLAPNFVKDFLDAVTPKERCFGDSFSRPSAPTVVSVDTAPYEFCWKVCDIYPGDSPRSALSVGSVVNYPLREWASSPVNCGPLTAFVNLKNAEAFRTGRSCAEIDREFKVFLAMGKRSEKDAVWTIPGKDYRLLCDLPKGTRLYDRIMLLQEVK